jgi:methionyl-tRNA formyltransferase
MELESQEKLFLITWRLFVWDKQTIKIKEIQRQGKKPQNIGEFMLGSQIKKGAVI